MSTTAVTVNEDVESVVAAALADALPNVDLREVQIDRRAEMLRIVIDHPNGVDHALCVRATQALDATGLRDRFGVEMSSPGPEPPLRTLDHYRAAIGHTVALRVVTPDRHGATSVTGVVAEVAPERIRVVTPDGDRWVSTDAIRRGRVVEGSTA
jgi:ribosome maturation factor RimP